MKRFLWAISGLAALALAQNGEAPPAIAQGGVSNFASHIPAQLPSGGLARGALIRIRGWRLGPGRPERVAVRIRRGEAHAESAALATSENEVEARVPEEAPLGDDIIQVIRNGQASLEWAVTVVDSSFGAFSRNGLGWGLGDIANSDGAPNSESRPAQPGETVTLSGTGLGARPPRSAPHVLVAGIPSPKVLAGSRAAAHPGVDSIAFDLPHDVPTGCYVPVLVSSAPGLYSNSVTLAVSRGGKPCADSSGWSVNFARGAKVGTVALVHADLELSLSPRQTGHYPVDAGLAAFSAGDAGNSGNPLYMLPPPGTCTSYAGNAGLQAIASPLSVLDALPGTPLDGGAELVVRGGGGERVLRKSSTSYWGLLGGHAPVPSLHEFPLFIAPGEYRVSAPGGADLRPFEASVSVAAPIEWLNREQIAVVDRARGVSVEWRPPTTPSLVLILAMNSDSRTGASGLGVCLADSRAGSFRIPNYALANIPPSPAHPRGFPLNILGLIQLPISPQIVETQAGLDRVLTFALSVSARNVRFQ